MTPSITEPRGRGTILNALRVALRIISGKDIFICSSETPAGVSELLFHGRGRGGKRQLPRLFPAETAARRGKFLLAADGLNPLRRSRARFPLLSPAVTSSPGAGEVFPQRGSQAITFVAKVLDAMRKLPAVLLALPLGELSPKVTERAHAVALSAKVSIATRNLAATTKSRPLGEGGIAAGDDGRGNFREHLQAPNAKAARPGGLAAFMLIKNFYSTSSSAKIHSTSLIWEPLRE